MLANIFSTIIMKLFESIWDKIGGYIKEEMRKKEVQEMIIEKATQLAAAKIKEFDNESDTIKKAKLKSDFIGHIS